ncbi:MAG: hypothetical protein ACK55L_00930 [bacterium]
MEPRLWPNVFLSASVPHRPEWIAGSKPAEIEEAIIALARAVFARRGRLVFGGHPSVSPLVAAVAGEYFPADPHRQSRPVVIFQSEFFRALLPDETWDLHRLGWANLIWTPVELSRGEPDRAASLLRMRRELLTRAGPWDAMVAIGGMEGVLEEAELFLELGGGAPVCAFTTTGGAAAQLLDRFPRVRGQGQLRGIEEEFRARPGGRSLTGQDPGFEPYALMSQGLLDRLPFR